MFAPGAAVEPSSLPSPRTNEFTDPRQRFERALLQISARLTEANVEHRLVSDGHRGGDKLALVAAANGHLVELAVRRKSADYGAVAIFASNRTGLASVASALTGSIAATRRIASLQRGFVATIEAVASELTQRYDALAAGFPNAGLAALRRLVPDAEPMVGLTATCRRAAFLSRHETLLRRVLPTRAYAANVPAGNLRRAARWVAIDQAFALPSATLRSLNERGHPLSRHDCAAAAICSGTLAATDEQSSRPLEVVDAGLTSCDLADALTCELPGNPCDVGDCGGLDCFSLSPDCVPLDCGGCG